MNPDMSCLCKQKNQKLCPVEPTVICLCKGTLEVGPNSPHFIICNTEKTQSQVWQIHIQVHMVIYPLYVFESKILWRRHLSFWWQITFLNGIKGCGHLQWNRWATAGFHNNQSWLRQGCGTSGLIVRTRCDKQYWPIQPHRQPVISHVQTQTPTSCHQREGKRWKSYNILGQ